ncbi:MAG TPA: carboxypeptidase-like regulatory domain-containing protein [Candidatus Angelobacter sp.]|nr:carboxypeptidase-like regulatory domain-containing protein [Candidatus Angelobacter sp.]
MKRLTVVAAILLAYGALCVIPAARASALVQGSSRGEARTLVGRVVTAQDAPVQKAIVYLKNAKTLAIKTYISEADGSYRFPGLAANVDYEVYAEHEGMRSPVKTLSGFDNRKQANITLKLSGK